MQFQRFEDRIQVRIENDEPVVETLLRWLAREDIGYATLTGLGAVAEATVSYFNSGTKSYETHRIAEHMEVLSLIGNVSIKEGAPLIHAHATLGKRDLSVIGGHVNELIAHPTLEVSVVAREGSVVRELDENCGLYLMNLPERL